VRYNQDLTITATFFAEVENYTIIESQNLVVEDDATRTYE